MFNRSLFNRTLFNRVLPLFKNKEIISLLGEQLGFPFLEGLFQPILSFSGIEQLTIEQYGNFYYDAELDGSYKIYYNLNGKLITILEDIQAENIIHLVGELEKAIESGSEIDENLLGKLLEVNKDGEN